MRPLFIFAEYCSYYQTGNISLWTFHRILEYYAFYYSIYEYASSWRVSAASKFGVHARENLRTL